VIVKDTGKGFPEDKDFLMTETLGMQLVTDLVKQLNGTIRLDRSSGTKIMISF
jgi:two-component sensor histidine kinase